MNIYDFEDYTDFVTQNEDYQTIIENFGNVVLYKEALKFLQIAFPEWNSNAGVGEWSAEFLLNVLRNNEHLEMEYSFRKMLVKLYEYIAESYREYKNEWKKHFDTIIIDKFEKEYKEILELKSHLKSNDFDKFYNNLFHLYYKKELKSIAYYFSSKIYVISKEEL